MYFVDPERIKKDRQLPVSIDSRSLYQYKHNNALFITFLHVVDATNKKGFPSIMLKGHFYRHLKLYGHHANDPYVSSSSTPKSCHSFRNRLQRAEWLQSDTDRVTKDGLTGSSVMIEINNKSKKKKSGLTIHDR